MTDFVLPAATLKHLKNEFARCVYCSPGCLSLGSGELFRPVFEVKSCAHCQRLQVQNLK